MATAQDVCRLQGRNDRGVISFICNLTRSEAENLRTQKKVAKVGRCTYRIIPEITPSLSKESPSMLTIHDMEAVAGLRGKINDVFRERLAGWGLVSVEA